MADGPRPRLLVLASTYPRWQGDAEPGFVHQLARRLVGAFDVAVLCPHAAGAPTDEEMDGVRVKRYRYAPSRFETLVNDGGIVTNLRRNPVKWLLVPGFLLGQFVALLKLRASWRPDIIHAHWIIPQGIVVALAGVLSRGAPPFVVTSHGADLFALRRVPWPALKRFVLRRANAATVVSGAMHEALERLGVEMERVEINPMGVDLDALFTPDPGVVRSPNEILFVGRLVEKKGLRHLIAAMPEIVRELPTARLTIVGFGPDEAGCKAQVHRLGLQEHVSFTGAVPQASLPGLYRRAAVFVAPFVEASSGDQEGLGLVMVEAAACECPVIASDLPAVRHVSRDAGIRLVEPGCPAALAKAVCAVLASPPDGKVLSKAREALRLKYDWSVVAEQYASILSGSAHRARQERH